MGGRGNLPAPAGQKPRAVSLGIQHRSCKYFGNMRLLTMKTVLVATDLDEGSRVALETAKELARAGGAELHVVHVSEEPSANRAVNAALEQAELRPDDVHVHMIGG